MQLFLKQLAIFSFILLFFWFAAMYFVFFGTKEAATADDFLYRYQIQKIDSTKNVKTIFIGDSSLGNSIDGDVFSHETQSKTINLALTGLYGYAGSYNLLKRAFAQNPGLTNVVVMQTLDMQMRDISNKGYAYSLNNLNDYLELPFFSKIQVIVVFFDIKEKSLSLVKSIFGEERTLDRFVVNDYIRQGTKKDFKQSGEKFSPERWNSKKNFYLTKMVEFCDKNKLNLIYVYGPLLDQTVNNSMEYIQVSSNAIRKTGIFLVDTIVSVPNADLGDSHDHILPARKKHYTKQYASILKQYLKE